MQCDEARKRWHERLDTGAADPALNEHLEGCASCRLADREISSLLNQLQSLREASEHIGTHVKHHRTTRIGKGRSSWLSIAGLAAAIAMAVSTGWYFAHDSHTAKWPEQGHQVSPTGPLTAAHEDTGEYDDEERLGVSLLGDTAKRYIAVAQKTSNPRVRIYRLYATFEEDTSEEPSS